VDDYIQGQLYSLGFAHGLIDRHWHSYIGICDGGNVIYESEPAYMRDTKCDINLNGYQIICVSSPYPISDCGDIIIDGVNWTENNRGLNIVVIEREMGFVVDSVCFDTHVNSATCYRGGKKLQEETTIHTVHTTYTVTAI
jgi:hypothetical protein